ncbi:site-specific integrase [Lactobacillus taiwanensis]|uniref:site-specific integrase n=1 Tax=Lactobacillus taiwanensis TaxID=508451 RepID=UPI0021C35B6C|nr:site-specific integrase [Lactobacillus taiwanensis]
MLRHTYAALLTEQGVPMPTIQYLLGHKNLGMTAHYTQSAITDLKDLTPEI